MAERTEHGPHGIVRDSAHKLYDPNLSNNSVMSSHEDARLENQATEKCDSRRHVLNKLILSRKNQGFW